MKASAAPISGISHGAVAAAGHGGSGDRRDLCLHGAGRRDDLPGDRPPELRPGRDGNVLDLHRLAGDAMGPALLGRVRRRCHPVFPRRHRHRARVVPADPQRADSQQHRRLHRAVQHSEQHRRVHLGLHDQELSDPVRQQAAARRRAARDASGRHDRRHARDARPSLPVFQRYSLGVGDACGRGQSGIGPPRRHPGGLDDRARLGHGGGDRRSRGHADRARRVPRAQHDAWRAALRLRRRRARRVDQPGRRGARRLRGRNHREPRRQFHPLCRARAEADDRAGSDRRRADDSAERHFRPQRGQPGMSAPLEELTARESVPLEPVRSQPAARAPIGRQLAIAMAILAGLLLPVRATSFVTFELTQVMIYALAILGLNLLIGFNGQFSLGHSAFYGIGAYTAAILMSRWEVPYYLTLPAAGGVCFAVGFLFGLPALRLQGLYLALATFALAIAMPQILKFHLFEDFTGGLQGLVIDKPDPPCGLPIDADQWLYYFTLAVLLVLLAGASRLIRSRTGRAIMAIRDNPIAAAAMGINTALYKTLTFGVSALYTGVAGALGAIVVQFVAPDSFNFLLSVSFLVGLVIGGVGSIPGCLFGGLFVLFVPNIAESISIGLAGAIYGVILLIVIFVMPSGAAGFVRLTLARLAALRRARPKNTLNTKP